MSIPIPTFSPYSTNSKIRTGRESVMGIQAALMARYQSSKISGTVYRQAGCPQVSAFGKIMKIEYGTCTVNVPLGMTVWEYKSSWYDSMGSHPAGFYTSGSDYTGVPTYIDVPDVWVPGTPFGHWERGPAPSGESCRQYDQRIYIDLGEWYGIGGVRMKSIYYLDKSDGGTFDYVLQQTNPPSARWSWTISSDFDISGTADIVISIGSYETVGIVGSEAKLPDPDNRVTRDYEATFECITDYETSGSTNQYIQCDAEVNGDHTQTRVMTDGVQRFGTDTPPQFGVDITTPLASIQFSPVQLAMAQLGVKGSYFTMPDTLVMKHDGSWSGGSALAEISGSSASITGNLPADLAIRWDVPAVSYQFIGEARDMAGDALSPTPLTFKDKVSGNEWTGSASPVYTYSGKWTAYVACGDSTASHYSDRSANSFVSFINPSTGRYECHWALDDQCPAGGMQYEIVALNGETVFPANSYDDQKLWLQYPRERAALSVTVDTSDVVIDDFSSGWIGTNCTISSGGVVTDIGANAKISKTLTEQYWPPHRWIKLTASKTAGTWDGVLSVDDPGLGHNTSDNTLYEFPEGSPNKAYSRWKLTGGVLYADSYSPDIWHERTDSVQSLFDQIRPQDESWSHKHLSWSWGIGKITKIEIHLSEGAEYTCTQLSATATYPGESLTKALCVHPPYGDVMVRNGIAPGIYQLVNGRRWGEAATKIGPMAFSSISDIVDGDYWLPESSDDPNNTCRVTSVLPAYDSGWWDEDAYEYTNDSLLFCQEYCPALFLSPYGPGTRGSATLRSAADQTIMARPVYTKAKVHSFYGDGSGQSNSMVIYFANYYKGMAHGVMWENSKAPVMQSPVQSSYNLSVITEVGTEGITTSNTGVYTATDPYISNTPRYITTNLDILTGALSGQSAADSREWFRMALDDRIIVGGGVDLLVDSLTGMGIIAYIEDNIGIMRRTYNYGKTLLPVKFVSALNEISGLCLYPLYDARNAIGIVYSDGTDIKGMISTDWFATHEGVHTMLTGATRARARINPLTGLMLIAGWRTGGDIIVGRSYNYGKTLIESPIVAVSDAADVDFGLECTQDGRNRWCITYQESTGGDYKTMWSTDNGLSWSPA